MQKSHSGIAVVIGTKAELIKCMPIMVELQKQNRDYFLVSTGQHPLGKMCLELGLKKPDFVLSPEPKISTKFWSKINKISFLWFFSMIFKIKKVVKEISPKYVVYHGDTMSTAAAAIGSSKILNPGKAWKNVHLEAGLRSGSLWEPFPEEISRRISDSFSDILLAVSDLTESNLKKSYGNNKTILKTGNTIIDSSLYAYKKIEKKFNKEKKEYVLINIHRHEHLRNRENLRKIVEIINSIKTRGIWPLHDNTEYYLRKYGLFDKIDKKSILITPLKTYDEFIFLLANCKYLIADGGSIQEESLVFKKPCLVLRNRTERQEGLKTGINFLTMDVKKAKEIIKSLDNNKIKIQPFKNPYGKPGLSKKIIEILR